MNQQAITATPPAAGALANLSRRHFLGASGALVLGACLPVASANPKAKAASVPFQPNLFLSLETDGTVRVTAHRSEMGQGVRTALAQIIADELGSGLVARRGGSSTG